MSTHAMTAAALPAVLSLIGNTPLVEVTRFDTGPCRLFLKLESAEPRRLDQGPHRRCR